MEERVYEPKIYSDDEMRNKSGIYQIRNLINNKIYVGSAINLIKRKNNHFSILKNNKHRNNKLQNSYNLYGENNFIFEVIEFVENKNKIIEHEQYWIDRLNIVKYGYNICPIAGNITGFKHSDDYKLKITGSGNPFYGKHHTEETKQKMSVARKGKCCGEKNYWFGKKLPEETKQKIRDSKKNISQETRKKISESHRGKYCGEKSSWFGRKHTEETKQKMSKNSKNVKKVICLENCIIYNSITEASKSNNISISNISKCCRKTCKKTGGFHWLYYSEYITLTRQEIDDILKS